MVVMVTMAMVMVVIMASPGIPGRQTELTHLAVHLHLTQVGF